MIRIVLLIIGSVLLLVQQYLLAIDTNTQFIIFLSGIVLLGIPHGAADLLVASRNAVSNKKKFSRPKFLAIYVARLLLFGALLSLFPIVGITLFVLFAAYHFGETDLHHFKTNTLLGKLFVVSYGWVILSVILFHHFNEVQPILELFQSGKENAPTLNWLQHNRYYIMTLSGCFFFIITFIYFLYNNSFDNNEKGQFLVRFAIILIILFNLPMLLGFTYYFVVWHSVLSLHNIVSYLRKDQIISQEKIAKQILVYSLFAIAGIVIFGLAGFMFTNNNAIAAYTILGLAVLTAPHMQVMHDMYNSLRLKNTK